MMERNDLDLHSNSSTHTWLYGEMAPPSLRSTLPGGVHNIGGGHPHDKAGWSDVGATSHGVVPTSLLPVMSIGPSLLEQNQRNTLRPELRLAVTALVVAVIVFTTFGNLVTIIAVRLDRRLRSISNYYIASLAFADLIVGSFVMTFMLLYTVTFDGAWIFGSIFCDIWTFVDYVSCTASLTNVCLIASDRYQTVASPLRAIRRRTKRRAFYLIGGAWLIPIVFWATMIGVLRGVNGRPPEGSCFLIWWPRYLALVSASVIVYLPISAILTLFIAMMWLLRCHMRNMTRRMDRTASQRRRHQLQGLAQFAEEQGFLDSFGGISFNPRFNTTDISMCTLEKRSKEKATQLSRYDAAEDELDFEAGVTWIYCTNSGHRNRRFRSIGTNTSPERFGLVRTVGTNTSPLLGQQKQQQQRLRHDAEVHVPDPGKSTSISCQRRCDPSTPILSTPTHQIHVISPLPLRRSSDPHTEPSSLDTSTSASLSVSTDDIHVDTTTDNSDTDTDTQPTHHEPASSLSSCESTPRKWPRRYASLLRAERHSSMERSRLKQQLRAAKTLGLIMGFLLLCWLPFSVMWPVKVFCSTCISQRAYDVSFWTNYLNSSINPVIYCLCNPSFRLAFRRLLTRH